MDGNRSIEIKWIAFWLALLLGFASSNTLAGRAVAATATTRRVSVRSNGDQGNDGSYAPSISANGRFVAFASDASNLVANDTNESPDVFVGDRKTGTTRRVSVPSNGHQGTSGGSQPSISADGRFVAFVSYDSNLVPNDTNNAYDVFVHDRTTGTTTRVSVPSSGGQGSSDSYNPSISADGRFIAFSSYATNMVANDTNGSADVFVRDRTAGTTRRVSVSSDSDQGDGDSLFPSISANGRFVAFESNATNMVTNDTNGSADVFVRDRATGTTRRVSVSSDSDQGNDGSGAASISADGRFVSFQSFASNLTPNDTNATYDVFVRERANGTTTLVSVGVGGAQGNDASLGPAISADGRFVAFRSDATNLVANDTNGFTDVFVRDRTTGSTRRVSVRSNGDQGNHGSVLSSVSADGAVVAFESLATNLVPNDTNEVSDVFVRGPLR
jgi:Tol biopolymer transport system component